MRRHHREKLNKLLGAADKEAFIQLLWAINALQSNYSSAGRGYVRPETIPDGAITTDMTSEFFIYKWEIETLANELMTVPSSRSLKRGKIRILDCDNFQMIGECANRLRQLENAESRRRLNDVSILIEMARISSRQFDWQRGYVNLPQFYRNAFVYGQGACADYFECTYGITLNRFSQIGFMLYASFKRHPVVRFDAGWDKLGVSRDELEKVFALVSQPFGSASKLARKQRQGIFHTAYRPSILRQTPCLRFGELGERVRSPLPELILERITSGVFYDVVKGSGAIRNDYGKRFEKYCHSYLSISLPALNWSEEKRYRKKSNQYDTPDVLCDKNGQIQIAFECKSTRMSQEAMFGTDPMVARGFEDITKAVFQLWRFFSHSRRRYSIYEVAEAAVGVVLTLDNWLVGAKTLRERVIKDARKMADEKEPEITNLDRKNIVFVAVEDLERILSTATESTFMEALIAANSEKFLGWSLNRVHKETLNERQLQKRSYPFTEKLGCLLPWWDELDKDDSGKAS
jgi:hypothetical protein